MFLELFERLMLLFFTPKCYETIFLNFDFTNIECFKYAISKGLGYGILAGSLLVKVPQILTIVRHKNAEGISFVSELIYIVAVFGSMSYGFFKNYPISTYGDAYTLFVQQAIIVLLILYYNRRTTQMIALSIAIAVVSFLLFTNSLHSNVILALNASQIVLSLTSKAIQAIANYRNSSTGRLSSISTWLQFLGCVARIFTSLQETKDATMVITYILVSLANGILVFQLFYYRQNNKIDKTKKAE